MHSTNQGQKGEVNSSPIAQILNNRLFKPFQELKCRPSHKFRAHLVEIGVRLVSSKASQLARNIEICCDAIEALHLGSLIVDDIQDESLTRRNGSSLHSTLGVPHALSVGNWLYFHATQKLYKLQLEEEAQLKIQKEWLQAIECAHYGQVLDLTTDMSKLERHEIKEVCYYTAFYKTGCITGLAITLGAIIAGASAEQVEKVKDLGCALGVYLQQLNDIGNLTGEFDEDRRFEDLSFQKPSYIWSFTLDHLGAEAFAELASATRLLPDKTALDSWLDRYPAKTAAPKASGDAFDSSLNAFQDAYPDVDLTEIMQLKNRILKAYA